MCHKHGEKSISLTEQILLFCPSNNKFRNVLWHKLISRFGFDFYTKSTYAKVHDPTPLVLNASPDVITP